MSYKRLNEINLSNKSVLLRLDLNTPIENGLVANNERIVRSLPTLSYIIEAGARLIVMSHLGRPEENNSFQEEFSLSPVVKELESLLDKKIPLHSLDEFENLSHIPEISVIENTRFCIGEKTNDTDLSKRWASLADLVVMDAFATSNTYGKIMETGLKVTMRNVAKFCDVPFTAPENPTRKYVVLTRGTSHISQSELMDFLTGENTSIDSGSIIFNNKKTIDKIYCINLEHRVDRWQNCNNITNIERFDAVNTSDVTDQYIQNGLTYKPIDTEVAIYFYVHSGAYGAYLSHYLFCLLYTSPSPRDVEESRMPACA